MPCAPEILKNVSLFTLLDDDERAVLAAQVEVKTFSARQRIYRLGESGDRAYVVVSGLVEVTTVDEDRQGVLLDRPSPGDFFGFASMVAETAHETSAIATEETVCIEIDRHDILTLLQVKPHAGLDMMAVLGRQFHAAQQLVRGRAARNPNEVIEEQATTGDRIADDVARFGGSWAFIITFFSVLVVYTVANIVLGRSAWDPYPFILLNLFLSMLAAVQAPVIMMSQNRQDKKDRLRGELDFDVNRRAEAEIQLLSRKLRAMDDKLDDVADLLRAKPGKS
jgi:CRP/FNR family cyclic AMP-dependent transcriptional regulator